jgi:hypothetical protein
MKETHPNLVLLAAMDTMGLTDNGDKIVFQSLAGLIDGVGLKIEDGSPALGLILLCQGQHKT